MKNKKYRIEAAATCIRLKNNGYTQEEIAKESEATQPHVRNLLLFGNYSKKAQEFIVNSKFSMTRAIKIMDVIKDSEAASKVLLLMNK